MLFNKMQRTPWHGTNMLLGWLLETEKTRILIMWSQDVNIQFSSVQSLSHVQLFETPWTAARRASLSITNSQSLLKLMPIESVMRVSHRYTYIPSI